MILQARFRASGDGAGFAGDPPDTRSAAPCLSRPPADRVRDFIQLSFRQLTDPAFIAPMVVAQGVFGFSRLGLLRLIPGEVSKARALMAANLGAFALEGAAFVGSERGLHHALGRTVAGEEDALASLGHAYLTLGLLKGLGGLTHHILQTQFARIPQNLLGWQDRLLLSGAPHAAAFGGIYLSQTLAPALGLGPVMAPADRWVQSAVTVFHFALAGHVLGGIPGFTALNRQVHWQTQETMQNKWTHFQGGPLPAPLAALTGPGVSSAPELPHLWKMASQNGDRDGAAPPGLGNADTALPEGQPTPKPAPPAGTPVSGTQDTEMAPLPAPSPLPGKWHEYLPTLDAPPGSRATEDRFTQPPHSHEEITIGMRLGDQGRYEVKSLLGEGGQGAVYRVVDHRLRGQNAVIKVMRGEPDPEKLDRMEREHELGLHLKTDKIARTYDLFKVGNVTIPVMQFVEGRELDDILHGIRIGRAQALEEFPQEKRREIAAKLAEAVHEIHEGGVMHRDLKPANIMVTPTGQVRILDLGIGKFFADLPAEVKATMPPKSVEVIEKELTQAGGVFGTRGYWAPEVLDPVGIPTHNPRSYDVFALGAILYELVTGVPAFADYIPGNAQGGQPALVPKRTEQGYFNINPLATLQLVPEMRPPDFRKVAVEPLDEISLELEAAARRAMAPQPRDRYQSAEELRQAILMAPARVEKRRLDRIQAERLAENQKMQQAWETYRPTTRTTEEIWKKLNRPIKKLRRLHSEWHQGGENLVLQITRTMEGGKWPEAQRLLAQIAWERLLDYGGRIGRAEREAFETIIRENDIPYEDGSISGMKQALSGNLPVEIRGTDMVTDEAVSQDIRLKVIPLERSKDEEGLETDNYQLAQPLFEGSQAEFQSQSPLAAGHYLFEIFAPGFIPMKVPRKISLEQVRLGIREGAPLRLDLDFVPESIKPPRGHWYVVQGGEFTLGHDFINEGSPTQNYSYPKTRKNLKTILMSDLITNREWREFVEEKIGQIPDLKGGALRDYILKEIQPLLPMDTQPAYLESRLKKFITSAMERIRKKSTAGDFEDNFYWALEVKKVGKKTTWSLNDPKNPVDHYNTPLDPEQPVAIIDLVGVKEFIKRKNEKEKTKEKLGSEYRLARISELEGVSRNGFDWPFSWGYEFDPFRVVSRMPFPDLDSVTNQPLGKLPSGEDSGDQSLFGPRDLIGNVREFSSTEGEKNTVYIFGGSPRAVFGPYFNPSSRIIFPTFHRESSVGGFRLVMDIPRKKETSPE